MESQRLAWNGPPHAGRRCRAAAQRACPRVHLSKARRPASCELCSAAPVVSTRKRNEASPHGPSPTMPEPGRRRQRAPWRRAPVCGFGGSLVAVAAVLLGETVLTILGAAGARRRRDPLRLAARERIVAKYSSSRWTNATTTCAARSQSWRSPRPRRSVASRWRSSFATRTPVPTSSASDASPRCWPKRSG